MKFDIPYLFEKEWDYLDSLMPDGTYPTLEGIWAIMDAAWEECQCDPMVMDERISLFYSHPVWLLNGLFIEQHAESLRNRHEFAEYVANLKPNRVADFGGGYGTLARMIGAKCPSTEVHIVEPHPHEAAIFLSEQTSNVRYVADFKGEYDVMIATDVFEHVPDPLMLIESTAKHLRLGGRYLIANCFWPVIRCHLPTTFHFRYSWDAAMAAMNLTPGNIVSYGRSYKRMGEIAATSARKIERLSKRIFFILEHLPKRGRGLISRAIFSLWK